MSEGRASSTKTRSRVGSSKASSVSNTAAIARAKSEGARQQASLDAEGARQQASLDAEGARQPASLEAERARQQASLDSQRAIEKARLEATLERLAIEKETAAAIAEAEALEDAISFDSEHSGHSSVLGPQQDPHDSLQRTSEYVQQHSKADGHPDLKPEGVHFVNKTSWLDYPDHQKASYQLPCHGQENTYRGKTEYNNLSPEQRIQNRPQLRETPFASERYYTSWTQPETSNRYDRTAHMHSDNTPSTGINANRSTIDFVKFLARRELVTKGLVKFSDRAENYRAWRASFQNAIRDIGLSSSEEMDLLVKWLGSESAEHAKRIRDIDVNCPTQKNLE
ncbi:uncharacterized protein [Phyllobates terribilis]|uniref:uncharacterized protein isoform X2 n=1 Tax=Phyllobates terribilis TaxID=111132 RepID=UPI003CCB66C9